MLYTVIRSCSNKRFELVFMFHSIIITSTFFSTSSRLWSRPYLTEMWMKWSYFCTRKMKSMHWYVPNGTILVSVNYVSHLHMWCNNFGQIVRVTGHIGCVGLKSQCWKEIKNLFFSTFSCQDQERRTPLHAAAWLGDVQIMELLINAGMTLNSSAAFIDKTDLLSKADWTIRHSSLAKNA